MNKSINMNIGLSDSEISMIVGLIKNSGSSKAIIFGSRAKGTWRNNSDIDIAVFGAGVKIGRLQAQLDELPMPYKFDVICYEDINHKPLREHIDRVGIEIYSSRFDNDV